MSEHALVIGAGPAGLGAAAGLTAWCETVTVVEARSRGRLRHAGEHLPPAGLSALAALDLEEPLGDPRHAISSGVRSVWGDDRPADRDYFFSLPGQGLNLHRPTFDEALAANAERKGATLLFDRGLRNLEQVGEGYRATVSGPGGRQTLRASVVVDASGRRAVAARLLGATRRRHDQLVGVAGIVEGCPSGDDPGRLHIEATADGWWYGVQLPEGALLATFMTDAGVVRRHPEGARGVWSERLGASILLGPLAGGGRWSGRLDVFDASTQLLEPTPRGRFLAVGDAAAAYDPLSSWGISKGLCDGHAGAEALERACGGEAGALAECARRQRHGFARYCERRRDVYRLENRWPASPFWQARRQPPEHLAR